MVELIVKEWVTNDAIQEKLMIVCLFVLSVCGQNDTSPQLAVYKSHHKYDQINYEINIDSAIFLASIAKSNNWCVYIREDIDVCSMHMLSSS